MNRKTIEELIRKGETEKALEVLLALVRHHHLESQEHEVILLSGQFHELEKAQRLGVIAFSDHQVSMNKIKAALNHITGELPSEGKEDDSNTPSNQEVILFLSANPKGTVQLRVDEELRKIKDCLASATRRDSITLLSEPAVNLPTFTRALLVHQPSILHFSGHGLGQGISIEDEQGEEMIFPNEGLQLLFNTFKGRLHTVFLNACYSESQAEIISAFGLHVIGMNDEMGDKSAIRFAQGFYQALGEGKPVPQAFQMGLVHISTDGRFARTAELWYQGKKNS